VEDLVVIAAARAVLPAQVAVRPCWPRIGAPGAQVAAAFGATEWQIPDEDPNDPVRLAAAVGRTAVPR
jgi:2-iminoacetate synthase ThiH